MQIIYTRNQQSTSMQGAQCFFLVQNRCILLYLSKMHFSVICFVSLFASYVTLTNANHFVAFHFDRHIVVEDRKQCKEFSFFGSCRFRGKHQVDLVTLKIYGLMILWKANYTSSPWATRQNAKFTAWYKCIIAYYSCCEPGRQWETLCKNIHFSPFVKGSNRRIRRIK